MNAASIDLKDMLEVESILNLCFAENLFISREPASPVNTVTLFDYFGGPAELGLIEKDTERPSVQIRVRNTDFTVGWELINEIKTLLHGRANVSCNGAFYMLIACSSGPAFLDYDGNNNPRFVINFNLLRRNE